MNVVLLTPEELESLIQRAVASALEQHTGTGEVMTLESAAQFLKMHPKVLAKKATAGSVPATKIGPHWRFMRSQLVDHLKSQTKES